MIAWVIANRSIWALVAGAICSAILRVILSHAWLPGTPNRWQWDKLAFLEIFHFGKWIFLSSILGFLVNSSDRLLLAGLLSSTSFGIYSIASLIYGFVEQVSTKIMTDVSFPVLSEVVRDRPVDLRSSYYRFHLIIASFACFCSGFLMTSGNSLIRLLYDPRYVQAGRMLEILAVAMLTIPFRLATQSFLALGKPQFLSTIIAVRLVVLIVGIVVGFNSWGVTGALWGIVLSHFSYLPIIIFYNVRHQIFNLQAELYPLPMVLVGMLTGRLVASVI